MVSRRRRGDLRLDDRDHATRRGGGVIQAFAVGERAPAPLRAVATAEIGRLRLVRR